MGTRSLTFVHDEEDNVVVCVYQQYDGYFDGVGDRILSFLRGGTIVNGISMGGNGVTQFNGAGDLAVRLITYFKDGDPNSAGGVYIEPSTLSDGDVGTEFAYHIRCKVGMEPHLTARAMYQDFTVEGYVSDFVWPGVDDDGNYIAATGPMSKMQRAALFAGFSEAFEGDTSQETRYAFTRAVLGPQAPKSWSADGGITSEQAGRLLDTLKFLNQ
jgi:hypothetical protein